MVFYLYHREFICGTWQIIMWFLIWLKGNMEYTNTKQRENILYLQYHPGFGWDRINCFCGSWHRSMVWIQHKTRECYVAHQYNISHFSNIFRYIYLCVSLCVQIFLRREKKVPEWAWWATSKEFWEPVQSCGEQRNADHSLQCGYEV